jgi:hypothetical protein
LGCLTVYHYLWDERKGFSLFWPHLPSVDCGGVWLWQRWWCRRWTRRCSRTSRAWGLPLRATRALHFSGMFSDIVGHFRWDLIIIIDCLCWNQNFLALKSMDLSRKKIHPI